MDQAITATSIPGITPQLAELLGELRDLSATLELAIVGGIDREVIDGGAFGQVLASMAGNLSAKLIELAPA